MLGWLGLVVAPRWHVARDWAAPVIAPLMIGSVYIWLMASNGAERRRIRLVSRDNRAFFGPGTAARWIHYLAFDLFVGAWEVKDAQQEGIHHFAVIPVCLPP